jgi:hypothetical protein
MDTQPTINNAGDENEADSIYQVPNLENLVIYFGESTKFLSHNANHLVSLTLKCVNLESELPELPQLRECEISSISGGENYPLIFPKCKESLQCLVMNDSSLDDHALTMPQLKVIYVDNTEGDVKCSKFLSYNYKSLEIIFLQDVNVKYIPLDDGVKFERVQTVILLMSGYWIKEDLARIVELCPNAEVLIWEEGEEEAENGTDMKDFVMSNHRKQSFISDLKEMFDFDYY